MIPSDPFEALDRGVLAINRLAGLDLPRPRPGGPRLQHPEGPDEAAVEAAFDQQMACLFGAPDLPGGPFGGLSPEGLGMDHITRTVATLKDLDDAALVDAAFDRVAFQPIGLEDAFRAGGYVYPKLNHGYWEVLARRALRRLGLEGLREMAEFIAPGSMFDEFLAATLKARQSARGAPPGQLITRHFSLGLGLTNGDLETRRERYAGPLTPLSRGAMLGLLGFLDAMAPASPVHASDGAFPKRLIWDGLIHTAFDRICAASDAVVFVAPPHLTGIRIRGCETPAIHLVAPQHSVYRQWPAAIAYWLGRLIEIQDAYPRVTVLAQAAAATAPLGFLLDLLQPTQPGRALRYLDMGQALDIATLGQSPSGLWIQKPDIAARFADRPAPIWLDRG